MPSKPMIESARRGPYDELNTPAEAFSYLEPYCINPIWECAPGEGALVQIMTDQLRTVITAGNTMGGHDFTEDDPLDPKHYGMICTNPPFSKKAEFLARCNDLGKPWALLLPVTTLGTRKCQVSLGDAEIIFLPRRIDFTGKKAPWFAVAWFTKGLNIGKQLVFSD